MKISFVNYFNSQISSFHYHVTSFNIKLKEIKNNISYFLLLENNINNNNNKNNVLFVKFENKRIDFWDDNDLLISILNFYNISIDKNQLFLYYC
jgi:hypothetical protein